MSLSHAEVPVRADIQVVAARVYLNQDITVCSIYSLGSKYITVAALNIIVNQLASPYLILGDLNGHNRIWESTRTSRRGNIIEVSQYK